MRYPNDKANSLPWVPYHAVTNSIGGYFRLAHTIELRRCRPDVAKAAKDTTILIGKLLKRSKA